VGVGIVVEIDIDAPTLIQPDSDSVRLTTQRSARVNPCIEVPGTVTPNIHEVGGDWPPYRQFRPVRQTKGDVGFLQCSQDLWRQPAGLAELEGHLHIRENLLVAQIFEE
jgi:hypothetical protein